MILRYNAKIKSLEEARREFSKRRKCEIYLKRLRWPDGVKCPRCGGNHPLYMRKYRRWQCRSCRYQFSVTAGTIFHRSKIDLPRWFVAIWMMCHSPKGISAKQVERELGVHYETAWYMARRIRRAMKHDVFEDKLGGILEVDEAVVKADGGTASGNITFDAKNVLGVGERGGPLRMMVLDGLKAHDIKRVIAHNVDEVQEIFSEGVCCSVGACPRRSVTSHTGCDATEDPSCRS